MTTPSLPSLPSPPSLPSLRRRLAARVLDALLLGAAGVAYGIPLGFRPVWLVAHAAVVYGYFVAFDTRGATPGKRMLGLRVTDASGHPLSVGAAARREAFVLLGAVPFAGPLLALTSWVAIGVTARRDAAHRGLHDTFAGTAVVAA